MTVSLGLGFRAAERRAETLPVGETGGATGVGGFAGNRLHGTRSRVEEAGRKPLRRALGAAPKANPINVPGRTARPSKRRDEQTKAPRSIGSGAPIGVSGTR